jgi:hypothetical protein
LQRIAPAARARIVKTGLAAGACGSYSKTRVNNLLERTLLAKVSHTPELLTLLPGRRQRGSMSAQAGFLKRKSAGFW